MVKKKPPREAGNLPTSQGGCVEWYSSHERPLYATV